jgi:penicillin-insensitive murein endopeptidase
VSGDNGCGQELANWYAMLKKAAIESAKPPPPGTKPWTGKPPLTMAQLPKECGTVLTAGGFQPPTADSEPTSAALKAMAAKDAGPPLPTLTPDQLKALVGPKTDTAGTAGTADTAEMPLPDRNPVR